MAEIQNLEIGIMLPTHAPRDRPLNPEVVGSTAEWAEAQGFDAVWAGDHIVHPWHFLESLTSLTFAAARTRKIRIGTCVLLLPMRQLSLVGAQIATLSTLSAGRFDLGIGIGGEWPREWQAANVPTSERGARLDEALPLLRRLFAGETIDFEGRFNSFAGVSFSPTPPPIPFLLAGRAPAALDRVGRQGDGWMGFFLTPNGFRRDSALIDEARERAGRTGTPFRRGMLLNLIFAKDNDVALRKAQELNWGFAHEMSLTGTEDQLKSFALAGTPARIVERLEEYIAAGCTSFCFAPMEKDNSIYQEQLDILATDVVPKLRSKERGW
jgi:alkanesulfonate monooxygenase SsuD/methylene tetrahydromethanopterin reductase-like flavin-dependent oxidoreductase (luciferase family)